MGRPVAKTEELPFGMNGFIIYGAYSHEGEKLRSLRIYKQRSANIFDLVEGNGSGTVYEYMKLVHLDIDGNEVVTNQSVMKNGTFSIAYNDENYIQLGNIVKILSNKVILSDGTTIYNNA